MHAMSLATRSEGSRCGCMFRNEVLVLLVFSPTLLVLDITKITGRSEHISKLKTVIHASIRSGQNGVHSFDQYLIHQCISLCCSPAFSTGKPGSVCREACGPTHEGGCSLLCFECINNNMAHLQ